MTDDEVTRILAERERLVCITELAEDDESNLYMTKRWVDSDGQSANVDYLTDRNALARVIGKMTEEERDEFSESLWNQWQDNHRVGPDSMSAVVWLLTCDPRIIAEACAAAIKEGGGE